MVGQDDDDNNNKNDPPPPVLIPEIRGMLGDHGDSQHWLDAVGSFPNGVPRFDSRAACLDFMQNYVRTNGGSNPEYPHLQHIFTMLISWKQVETMLLPAMEQARKEPSSAKRIPQSYGTKQDTSSSKNIYEQPEARSVHETVADRLNVPFHQCTTVESVHNTLKYLFFHMRCGIYVMIRNGKLRIFCPFVNSSYRNTWDKVM